MELNEAIELIRCEDIAGAGNTVWADLGAGSGLFSRALASLLEPGSTIYAIDKEPVTPAHLSHANGTSIQPLQLDFVSHDLPVPELDGILMANSLHYVSDQAGFLRKAGSYLKKNGCFLVIEYDTDVANRWVPHPLSYHTLVRLFHRAGYTSIRRLQEHPSIYGRANMYAVLIRRSS